jgi:hypothetical protein
MPLINTDYMVATYTDDFGKTYPNIPIKFSDSVSGTLLTAFGYALRSGVTVCGGNLPFQMRYLQAVFADGTSHQFPVFNRANIAARVASLKANDAICINLVGEQWNVLPPSITGEASFKSTPYTDISPTGLKTSYSFTYSSDVLSATSEEATEPTLTLKTSVETAPTALHDCQIAGLEDATAGSIGICSIAGVGIDPRKYIIQALAKKGEETKFRRVVRQAIVSNEAAADILAVVEDVSSCAYCLGYRGESITNVHAFI